MSKPTDTLIATRVIRRKLRRNDAVSTRDLIVAEAMRLVARDGVQELRLSDIADAIGIQPPSIYKHFASRDAIVATIGGRMMDEMGEHLVPRTGGASSDWLVAWTRSLVWFFATRPAYVRLILSDLAAPQGFGPVVAAIGPVESTPQLPQVLRFTAPFRDQYEAGVAAGTLRPIDYSHFFRLIFGMVLVAMVWPYGGRPFDASAHELDLLQQEVAAAAHALTKAI